MCGIFGFQVRPGAELTPYESTMISMSLAKDMEGRGHDSFGGVSADGGQANVIRGLGRITEAGSRVLKLAAQSRTFLGHTRAATVGAVSIENSHPFLIDNILGVHNGSVRNYDYLNKKYDRKFQVDSQQVFAHINDNLSLEEVEGYGVFFWLRDDEQWSRVWFGKTNSGSLTVAKFNRNKDAKFNDKDHFMVAWASEYGAIKKIADLLDVKYDTLSIASERLHYIENAVVYESKEVFKLGTDYTPIKTIDVRKRAGVYGYSGDRTTFIPGRGWVNPDDEDDGQSLVEKSLSRKERKALRRRQDYFRKKNFTEWAADPIAENINDGKAFPKVFSNGPHGTGTAVVGHMCPECNCDLEDHSWSACSNSKYPKCKAKADQSCTITLSVCTDCGHYLINSIHTAGLYGIVSCKICNNYCAPETTTIAELAAFVEEKEQEAALQAEGNSEIALVEIDTTKLLSDGHDGNTSGMSSLVDQVKAVKLNSPDDEEDDTELKLVVL